MAQSEHASEVSRRGVVGAIIAGALTSLAFAFPESAWAQPKAKCVRVGQKIIFNGYAYSCARRRGRLTWVRGKKINAVVSAPSATPTTSTAPSVTPSPTATPNSVSTQAPAPAPTVTPTASPTTSPTPTAIPSPSPTISRSGFFIAKSSEVILGESKIFTGINLAGRSVKFSLFRSPSGVSAIDIYCTHAGCAVTPEGAELVCKCHFSYFDAATGARKSGPAPTGLPTFAVSEIEGEIYILGS